MIRTETQREPVLKKITCDDSRWRKSIGRRRRYDCFIHMSVSSRAPIQKMVSMLKNILVSKEDQSGVPKVTISLQNVFEFVYHFLIVAHLQLPWDVFSKRKKKLLWDAYGFFDA